MSKNASIGIAVLVVFIIGLFFFQNTIYGFFQSMQGPAAETDTQGMYDEGSTSAPHETINPETSTNQTTTMNDTNTSNTHTTADGLIITDEKIGTGEEAKAGQTVTVNYVGTFLNNGEKFDSSYDRNQPFVFTLGAGQVIQGWDEGFAGMKVGGKRKLVVPPNLGYGPNDYGPIPGNSTLVFEVELLGVK